jgi:hypothetical protein
VGEWVIGWVGGVGARGVTVSGDAAKCTIPRPSTSCTCTFEEGARVLGVGRAHIVTGLPAAHVPSSYAKCRW